MQAIWAEMATEVWNDDRISIKKNEISSNGKLLPSRYFPGNFIKSISERCKCFLEWVDNFYLRIHYMHQLKGKKNNHKISIK